MAFTLPPHDRRRVSGTEIAATGGGWSQHAERYI